MNVTACCTASTEGIDVKLYNGRFMQMLVRSCACQSSVIANFAYLGVIRLWHRGAWGRLPLLGEVSRGPPRANAACHHKVEQPLGVLSHPFRAGLHRGTLLRQEILVLSVMSSTSLKVLLLPCC